MGKGTSIQWCDDTVNPTTGCDGCELWKLMEKRADMLRVMGGSCYAGNFHEQRLAKSLPNLYAPDFTEVRLVPGRMAKAAAATDLAGTSRPGKPWLDGMPRVIFVGDMGDVLSGAVPFDYLKAELIDVARSPRGRRHIWMVLTKRPERLAEFAGWLRDEHGIAWPANVWPGTSITGKASLRRLDSLVKVPSRNRFASVEPLVEDVDLTPWLYGEAHGSTAGRRGGPGGQTITADPAPLSLVIVGGESGPVARRFELAWARSVRDQCAAADVAYFCKQLGASAVDVEAGVIGRNVLVSVWDDRRYTRLKDPHGGDMEEWPEDLRIRQMPQPTETVTS